MSKMSNRMGGRVGWGHGLKKMSKLSKLSECITRSAHVMSNQVENVEFCGSFARLPLTGVLSTQAWRTMPTLSKLWPHSMEGVNNTSSGDRLRPAVPLLQRH